jgi:hypothetical protein
MLKRFIGISFIFIASIILLAHSAIPHHHHQKQVCLLDTHCAKDDATNRHQGTNPGHEDDGECQTQLCILKQDLFVSKNSIRSAFLLRSDSKIQIFSFKYQTGFLNLQFTKSLQPVGFSLHKQHFYIPFYIRFLNHSDGLRAPPLT